MSIIAKAGVRASVECKMVLRPGDPNMSMNEALDRFQAAHPENKIHDYGTDSDVAILGWNTRHRIIGYDFIPEESPPGFTIQDAMRHLRAAGFDVRGLSEDGKFILVSEEY